MKTDIKKIKLSLLNKIFFFGIFSFIFLFTSQANAGPVTVSGVTDTAEYVTAEVTGKYTLPADGVLPEGFVYAVYSTDPTFPGGGTAEHSFELSSLATGNFFTIYFDGLTSGETYYYKVVDLGTTYATGDFTTATADISIGDTVTVSDGGAGTVFIKGTYNKGPATEIPGANYFIYALYGTSVDSLDTSSSVATISPITGYDTSVHGNFTISIPTAGLTAGEPYYFKLLDFSKTYYSIDPDTGEAPFFEVDPDNVPDPVTLSGTTSTVDCDGEDGYCLLAPIGDLERITPDVDFGKYVNTVLGVIIGIAGAIAVVMFVVAGIQYMASDVITSKGAAIGIINNTLSGLALLLGAFILLRTINPDLVDFKFALKKVDYELEGDEMAAPIGEISITGDYLPDGVSCPGTGGSASVKSVAESFVGKTTYNQALRLSPGPEGTIYLDCSSYANYVRACTGLPQVAEVTVDMFNEGNKTITSLTGTTVNGNPLKPGDLLGWEKGECAPLIEAGRDGGHVVVYIGDGKIIDTHGPTYPGNGGKVGDATDPQSLDSYSRKSCLYHYIPI